MELNDYITKLDELERKMAALNYVQGIVYYDSATVAPAASTRGRSDCMAMLAEESYKLFVNDDVGGLLSYLYDSREALQYPVRRRVEILKEEYDKNYRIPMDEYVAYSVLCNEAENAWQTAKEQDDFEMFEPYLEKIVATLKRFAGYFAADKDPYDVWLNEHEKGLSRRVCDAFFAEIKASLVPLIKEISIKPPVDDSFLKGSFPVEKQRELSEYLAGLMTLPAERCIIGETEHPFSIGLNTDDVRITTHYYENSFMSSMYSVIHEAGHALYELGCNPEYRNTCIASPLSTSIHESQSRFFENYIARSEQLITYIMPKLRELFPVALDDISPRELYLAINKSQPSLIRIEADELTYSLHVLIRYEIEKLLFDGKITTKQLPETWNRLYKEYLGVDVPDNRRGVLQDTHWGGGMFGYFPSYSLGSAYAAQMLDAMSRDIPVFEYVAKGDLAPVVGWLKARIHHDAGTPLPEEIIEKSCGAAFSPKYYAEYLTRKFSDIYELH